MATRSDNIIGNPYHDEKTGKFTSAGISALKSEVLSDNLINNKQALALNKIKEAGSLYNYLNSLNRKIPSQNRELSFFIDDYINIPLLMKNYGWAIKQVTGGDVRINTDELLDKIGVDLICTKSIEEMTPDNIYEKMNLIDVKTGKYGTVELNLMQTASGGNLVKSDLLNPNYKNNNLYVFSYLDNLPSNNSVGLALKMLNPDLSLKKNDAILHSAFLINRKELHKFFYEYIDFDDMESAYDFIESGLANNKWGSREEMMTDVFSQDADMKNVSEPDSNEMIYEMELSPGLKLCARCYMTGKNLNFRVFASFGKEFIASKWPNNELSYSNVKNNKVVF